MQTEIQTSQKYKIEKKNTLKDLVNNFNKNNHETSEPKQQSTPKNTFNQKRQEEESADSAKTLHKKNQYSLLQEQNNEAICAGI